MIPISSNKMDVEKTSNEKTRIVFSVTAASIITDILKRYGLEMAQERMLQEMASAPTFLEKEKIFEKLPGRQIAKMVRAVAEGEIPRENFSAELQKQLNISPEAAEEIVRELKEKVLIFTRRVPIPEEREAGPRPTTLIKPAPKEFVERPRRIEESQEIPKTEITKTEIKPKLKKPDPFREPLE